MKPKEQTIFYSLYNNGIEDVPNHLKELYENGMSCKEIAEHLTMEYGTICTPKGVDYYLKKINTKIRTKTEAKLNAMKRGRMVYHKKPEHEKYKRNGISQKMRMLALKRDNFKCTLCGNSPQTGSTIELHHINGADSTLDNLQTLCFACHRGMHYTNR